MEGDGPAWWRRLVARRWQRVLLAVLLVAIVVRIALPTAVRRVLVSQADVALVGRIELDDVDLALLTGGFTLRGLRVFAQEAMPAGAAPAPSATPAATGAPSAAASSVAPAEPVGTPAATMDAPAVAMDAPATPMDAPSPQPSVAGAGPAGAAPVFSAERLTVDLGLLAFLHKMVDVQQLDLEGVAVSLDRAKDGALVLPAAVPSDAPPATDAGPGWGVLIESVKLRDGRIGFRDFAVGDPPQQVEVTLPTLDADQLALLITQSGVAPGKVTLDAGIQDGSLHLEATIESLEAGPAYESHAVLTNIPIADGRLYIPKVGWSGLSGRLDADLVHRFESHGAHTLRGKAALRELAVRVADLDDPALAWGSLDVDLAGLDFVAQHAEVTSVTLAGARVVTRPGGPEPLPVLRGLAAAAADAAHKANVRTHDANVPTHAGDELNATATPMPSPEPSPSPAAAAAVTASVAASAPKPWSWVIGKVLVQAGQVRAIGGDGPLEIGIDADLGKVASAEGTHTSVQLGLTSGSGGRIDVGGDLVVAPFGFAGKVSAKDLALAALTQPVASATTRVVKHATANLALDVAAGSVPQAPPDGVRVAGTLGLADLDVAGDDPKVFAVRWKDLALAIQEITVPGVLKPGTAPAPVGVALTSLTLTRPELVLTRNASGLVLPGADTGEPSPAAGAPAPAVSPTAPASATAAKAPPPPAEPVKATPPPVPPPVAAAPAPVQARVDRLAIQRLRIEANDSAVQPFYRSALDPVDLTATDVHWPDTSAKDLKLVAKGLDGAAFTLTGNVAPAGSRLVAKLTDLPLAPFNPYAAGSGYGVGGGTAALDSTIKLAPGRYDARSRLVLHQLDVRGGEGDALFTSRFGMPLSLALSLMTDLHGDIVLDLPITGDAKGTRTDLGTLVGNALARAILNAVTSPLKLLGAVASIGDKPASLAPAPLAFLAGRPTLADGEAAKLAQLARVVGAAPGLMLHLRGEAGEDDRRWLREQSLRATLEKESGVVGRLRHIGEQGPRKAALAALTARAEGRDAPIPPEHQAWFDAQIGAQPVGDDAVRALASARATAVQEQLTRDHGVGKQRTVLDDATIGGDAASVVTIGLGSAAPSAAKR